MTRQPGHARQAPDSAVPLDQPLIGLILEERGQAVVRYFATEEDADRATAAQQVVDDALSLAGVWSDLDWQDMQAALDRIRHASPPTPPIEL
jgi:hypothetical protein